MWSDIPFLTSSPAIQRLEKSSPVCLEYRYQVPSVEIKKANIQEAGCMSRGGYFIMVLEVVEVEDDSNDGVEVESCE